MSAGLIRRAQLVAPFGIGAMTVLADGTGVLAAGLDHWFQRPGGDDTDVDEEEFRIEEWRLQAALNVDGFRLPPDWRWNLFGATLARQNLRLPIPFLRFPSWNFCRFCKRMSQRPTSYRELPRCEYCAKGTKKGPALAQVPFVAVCDYGHLQDFPFREWVHRSPRPGCNGQLSLRGTGAASLAAQLVRCGCEKSRNLSGITEGSPAADGKPARSFLSEHLAEGDEYLCTGITAWHGEAERPGPGCGKPLRGSLRAASNVYYPLVRSAIYLPRSGDVDAKLLEILTSAPLGPVVRFMRDLGTEIKPADLRKHQAGPRLLGPYTDRQLVDALSAVWAEEAQPTTGQFDEDWDEVAFRRPEYEALQRTHDTPDLKVQPPIGTYSGVAGSHLTGIMLAERLRETRALYGFNRINADNTFGLTDRKALLRSTGSSVGWLPAYIVNGEGILIGLDLERLRVWEARPTVVRRAERLDALYQHARKARSLRERDVRPRFVLLHTLSHLLMNRLTFNCGYSSAALRERLFIDDDMAGVLIYTAAGDADGTMGGLVRMGRPGMLEVVVEEALDESNWCSSDPICMECGDSGGQGPDSCNLAACHSCSLVPETACEEFNRFLDRGLIRGTFQDPYLGYFSS